MHPRLGVAAVLHTEGKGATIIFDNDISVDITEEAVEFLIHALDTESDD